MTKLLSMYCTEEEFKRELLEMKKTAKKAAPRARKRRAKASMDEKFDLMMRTNR